MPRKLDYFSSCCGENVRAKKNQLAPDTELEQQQVMDGRLDFTYDNNTLPIDYCVTLIYIKALNENIRLRDVCVTTQSLLMVSLFINTYITLP